MDYKQMEEVENRDPPTYYSQPSPNLGVSGYGYDQGDFRGYPSNINNTTIVQQPQQVMIQVAERLPSTAGSIVLSCIVFWLCCCPLGLASFIVAVVAEGMKNATEKRSMIRVSYILSIIGLAIGVVLLIVVLALHLAGFIFVNESMNYMQYKYIEKP